MDEGIIAAMERELATLDAKAAAIRAVVTLYRSGGTYPPARVEVKSATRGHSGANDGTTVDSVLKVARALCDSRDGPVPTREIMDQLTREGVEIAGQVPQNVVSSILSRSAEFQANGRAGWTLIPDYFDPPGFNENGEALASPDAEEVAASSMHSQEIEDLPG